MHIKHIHDTHYINQIRFSGLMFSFDQTIDKMMGIFVYRSRDVERNGKTYTHTNTQTKKQMTQTMRVYLLQNERITA